MVDVAIKFKRSKLILSSILCVVFAGFIISQLKKNINIIAGLREKIAINEKSILVLDEIYKDANDRREEIERVLATIPSTYDEISTYAKIIELVANDSGVSVEIKFADSENKETYGVNSISVTASAKGSYENLIKFLDAVYALPYHSRIDSLVFEEDTSGLGINLVYRLFTNIN